MIFLCQISIFTSDWRARNKLGENGLVDPNFQMIAYSKTLLLIKTQIFIHV